MKLKSDRLRFEEWISGEPYVESVERFPDDEMRFAWPGGYRSIKVELAWQAWQEARRAMPTKEEVYDEQISPLMTQIIAICKEHKIANVMSFSLDLDEGLCCTTCMTLDEFEPPEKFKECVPLLYSPDQQHR